MVMHRHLDASRAMALRHVIPFPFDDVGTGVADAKRGAFLPGYAFRVVDVEHFVRDVTTQFDYDVRIGTTSVLAGYVAEPAVAGTNTGNGTVDSLVAGAAPTAETITLTGDISLDASTCAAPVAGVNTGDGTVGSVVGKASAPAETITLTCKADTSKFTVSGDVTGALADATVGTPYTSAVINFTITPGETPFAENDSFTIAVTHPIATWSVVGDVSGALANATVGEAYESDAVNFTLTAGGTPFADADSFTIAVRKGSAPADATRATATLSGTYDNLKGTASDVINLHLSTDGAGGAQEGTVYVTIVPQEVAL